MLIPNATMFGMIYDGSFPPWEVVERWAPAAAMARPMRTSSAAAVATAVRITRIHKAGCRTDALPSARQKNEATGLTSLRNAAVGTLTVPPAGLRVRQASAYTLRWTPTRP